MSRFKVGDTVIPLSGKFNKYSQDREFGVPCEVTAVMYCSKEGFQLINVNNNERHGNYRDFGCPCGEMHANSGLAWTKSSEFVGGESIQQVIDKALEIDDYALAIKLRDLNNK